MSNSPPGLQGALDNLANWYYPRHRLTPGGTPHMKGVGMLVGNFELNP